MATTLLQVCVEAMQPGQQESKAIGTVRIGIENDRIDDEKGMMFVARAAAVNA